MRHPYSVKRHAKGEHTPATNTKTKQRKIYQWARSVQGGSPRYSLIGVEVNEPHVFGKETFDAQRCREIHAATVEEMPEGKLIVGHNRGQEGWRVGSVGNYRMVGAREFADFTDIEPEAFLRIARGNLNQRSVEFEWPGQRLIEAVSLLGSSRQFFDSFPDLRVELTPKQWEQLKKDAHDSPLPWRSRRKPFSQEERMTTNPHIDDIGDDIDDGADVGNPSEAHREMPGENTAPATTDGVANAPQGDTETRLSNLEKSRDEFGARLTALEDRVMKANDGDADNTPAAPEMAPMPAGRSKPKSPEEVHRIRLANLEMKVERGDWSNRIAAQRARGVAISPDKESEIIDAVLAKPSAHRAKTFATLTAGLPQAPLTDNDGASVRVKPAAGDEFAKALELLPERFRSRAKANRSKLEKEAAEIGMSLGEYVKSVADNPHLLPLG